MLKNKIPMKIYLVKFLSVERIKVVQVVLKSERKYELLHILF